MARLRCIRKPRSCEELPPLSKERKRRVPRGYWQAERASERLQVLKDRRVSKKLTYEMLTSPLDARDASSSSKASEALVVSSTLAWKSMKLSKSPLDASKD